MVIHMGQDNEKKNEEKEIDDTKNEMSNVET